MTAKTDFPKSIRWSFVLGVGLHLISYIMPMNGIEGRIWAKMYWVELLPRFLNVLDWSFRDMSLGLLYLPLVLLLVLIIRWFGTTDPAQKVPRPRWLVLGLILPNSIIPPMSIYAWITRGRSLIQQEMIAYFVWNASFGLFFYGFWRYYHYQQTWPEKTLLDHLIDEE